METGRSVKENQLAKQRVKADINPIMEDAEDLREYERDAILSHKRKGKGYEYLVSWKHTSIQSWLSTKDFVTKDIISEYWKKLNIHDSLKPKPYRK
jgi:hypothetical protein